MRILITGRRSRFLAESLAKTLLESGVAFGDLYTSGNTDLRSPDQVERLFDEVRPDQVYHLAGYNGGITFNQSYPGQIFADNTLMGINVVQQCAVYKTKLLSIIASCAYPEDSDVCYEEYLLNGTPNPTVACHGYAKRNLQLATRFFVSQYGTLKAACVCPPTLYGPGDRFDERSKFVSAMVRRFVLAKHHEHDSVLCFGSGKPLREIMYVDDCAKLLVKAMERYDNPNIPLNLSSGQEFSVKEVAEKIAAGVGYNGEIRWDTSKPDGQFRKRLFDARMKVYLDLDGFSFTPVEEGLARTIAYYRQISGRSS